MKSGRYLAGMVVVACCSGCAVVTVAGAAVSVASTAVGVGATVVGTAVDVTASGVRAVTGSAEKK